MRSQRQRCTPGCECMQAGRQPPPRTVRATMGGPPMRTSARFAWAQCVEGAGRAGRVRVRSSARGGGSSSTCQAADSQAANIQIPVEGRDAHLRRL
jgi:hypothetical protein